MTTPAVVIHPGVEPTGTELPDPLDEIAYDEELTALTGIDTFDIVTCRPGWFVMYLDDTGALTDQPVNRVATLLLSYYGVYVPGDRTIYGPVVLVGVNPITGDDADLRPEVLEIAKHLHVSTVETGEEGS